MQDVDNIKPWRDVTYDERLKIKKRDCLKCAYCSMASSIKLQVDTNIECDYILINKHSRQCRPGECREKGIFKERDKYGRDRSKTKN